MKCVVDASCNCGAPVVPAFQKAADVAQANPSMSTRDIAKAAGVGLGTAQRAKEASRVPHGTRDPDDRPTIDNPPKGAPWDDQNDRVADDQTVEKRVIGEDVSASNL